MKKEEKKYCPKCGKATDINDAYCIKCGYSFKGKGRKKIGLKKILIGILILIAAWVIIRIVTKQSILPPQISEFIKGFTGTNSTK